MPFLSKTKKRESAHKFKNDMLRLRDELKELIKTLEEKKLKNTKKIYVEPTSSDDDRIRSLENELRDLREKYLLMLEKLIELKTKGKETIPFEISERPTTVQGELNLGALQVLALLKESRATTTDFAVTAAQLKRAFGFDKSEKTIKNRLNYLARHNLVMVIGKRPKAYFLTPLGLKYLSKQERGVLKINHEML